MIVRKLAAGLGLALSIFTCGADAADYPAPKTGVWTAKDFKFQSGEVMPEVRLGYKTVGDPAGEPVLILHGTAGSANAMLTPAFAGELFGAGQPLDASRYFIIVPDALGAGTSSKPSDGLKSKFPHYNYNDMVDAQYRLVTEGLGIKRLRLVLGNSMGGMQTWIWSSRYPEMMDAAVPMASQPTEMASRNWMMRKLMIETIKADPDYKDGEYTSQPKATRIANVFYGTGTNGGNLGYQTLAPTREAADRLVKERIDAPFTMDTNDFLYQWDSSRDYNPSGDLPKITAMLLAINSADDERNPPESGLMETALKQVRNGRLLLIPASTATRGHGTTGMARFWAPQLGEFLKAVPKKGT